MSFFLFPLVALTLFYPGFFCFPAPLRSFSETDIQNIHQFSDQNFLSPHPEQVRQTCEESQETWDKNRTSSDSASKESDTPKLLNQAPDWTYLSVGLTQENLPSLNQAMQSRFKPKLLLHIGPMKTGTSALQNFLNVYQEKLEDKSILFPVVPETNPAQGGNAQPFLEKLLAHTGHPDLTQKHDSCSPAFSAGIEHYLRALRQAAYNKHCDTVISSSELWSLLSPQSIHDFAQSAQHYFDVHVVAYVRELGSWSQSCWVQHMFKELDFDLNCTDQHFFFLNNLKAFKDHFGQVSFINYDRHKNDHILHFLQKTGIKTHYFSNESLNRKVKLSLTESHANLILLLQKIGLTDCLPAYTEEMQNQWPRPEPSKTHHFYDKKVAQDLYKTYAPLIQDLNESLSQEDWLPSDEKSAFSTLPHTWYEKPGRKIHPEDARRALAWTETMEEKNARKMKKALAPFLPKNQHEEKSWTCCFVCLEGKDNGKITQENNPQETPVHSSDTDMTDVRMTK